MNLAPSLRALLDWHRTARHRFVLAVLAAAVCPCPHATAASAPDWVRAAMMANAGHPMKNHGAVMLLDSEKVTFTASDRIHQTLHGAIRTTKSSGREYAGIAWPYDADTEKILSARAWVISPDGSRVEAFSIRDFTDQAMQYGSVYWNRMRVVALSAAKKVEINGVFAWEIELQSQEPISDVSFGLNEPLPTELAEFEVIPPPQARLEWHAGDRSIGMPAIDATGRVRWEWHNVVVRPPDEAPPGFIAPLRWASVRAIRNSDQGPRTWRDVAQLIAATIEPRLVPTDAIKTEAARLTDGKAGRWDRIRALTEFAQKEIVYVGLQTETDYLAGHRPHFAAEVLRSRFGDCKDKAALLVALLRAIGESADVILVSSGDPKAIDPAWPALRFNHAIVAIAADEATPEEWPLASADGLGRQVFFDPTHPDVPLGQLPDEDQGGYALPASAEVKGLVTVPITRSDRNRDDARIHVVLLKDGTARIDVVDTMRGAEAIRYHAGRSSVGEDRNRANLESLIHDTVPEFAGLKWGDAWNDAEHEARREYSFVVRDMARPTGANLFRLNPEIIWTTPRPGEWKTKQPGGVWLPARSYREQIRITLPAGATAEELPEPQDEKAGKLTWHVRYRQEGKSVIVDCELKQQGGFADYESYESRRLLLQRIEQALRRPILYRLTGTAGQQPNRN